MGKQKKSGKQEKDDEAKLFSHPTMKSLIYLKQNLDQFVDDSNLQETIHEAQIKEQMCDLLNYLIDLRQNYLLSNLVEWFDNLYQRSQKK
mmetsp:Transcript_30988/g.28191  ORF Transcript_30988/g.28191 Transcript_30988/m.28191 type:complete len:90 (+) Transcript_30988:3200-3469(+)